MLKFVKFAFLIYGSSYWDRQFLQTNIYVRVTSIPTTASTATEYNAFLYYSDLEDFKVIVTN